MKTIYRIHFVWTRTDFNSQDAFGTDAANKTGSTLTSDPDGMTTRLEALNTAAKRCIVRSRYDRSHTVMLADLGKWIVTPIERN